MKKKYVTWAIMAVAAYALWKWWKSSHPVSGGTVAEPGAGNNPGFVSPQSAAQETATALAIIPGLNF